MILDHIKSFKIGGIIPTIKFTVEKYINLEQVADILLEAHGIYNHVYLFDSNGEFHSINNYDIDNHDFNDCILDFVPESTFFIISKIGLLNHADSIQSKINEIKSPYKIRILLGNNNRYRLIFNGIKTFEEKDRIINETLDKFKAKNHSIINFQELDSVTLIGELYKPLLPSSFEKIKRMNYINVKKIARNIKPIDSLVLVLENSRDHTYLLLFSGKFIVTKVQSRDEVEEALSSLDRLLSKIY